MNHYSRFLSASSSASASVDTSVSASTRAGAPDAVEQEGSDNGMHGVVNGIESGGSGSRGYQSRDYEDTDDFDEEEEEGEDEVGVVYDLEGLQLNDDDVVVLMDAYDVLLVPAVRRAGLVRCSNYSNTILSFISHFDTTDWLALSLCLSVHFCKSILYFRFGNILIFGSFKFFLP
jgi:hypothetical protein